jgi:limonene-1,2-epoxide hydrolase
MKLKLALAAILCALTFSPVPAAAQDTDAKKLAVVQEMMQAWKNSDWRKVGDLFAEDGVLWSMMVEPVQGREAIYKRIAALGEGVEGGVTLDVTHMGIIDGLVFMERTDRFIYKGKAGSVPVVGILDVRNGKVQEWREYYDRASLMSAMGVNP